MTLLELDSLNNLRSTSPCLFIKALHGVEFYSLKVLHGYQSTCIENTNYCQLQTNPFKSTRQLADGMKLINGNATLINSINNLYLSTIIQSRDGNNINDGDESENSNYFDQICDILHEWIENGKKNILLSIKIAINTHDDCSYCEKFAVCLYDKIDTKNTRNNEKIRSDNCVELLQKQNFTSPYYGGSVSHCNNEISIKDRVRIGVHMSNMYNIGLSGQGFGMEFTVQVLNMSDDFGHKQNLIHCNCRFRNALPGYGYHPSPGIMWQGMNRNPTPQQF